MFIWQPKDKSGGGGGETPAMAAPAQEAMPAAAEAAEAAPPAEEAKPEDVQVTEG